MTACKCLVLLLLLFVPSFTVCQQETGTILVFRFMPDHAVVAADSKTMRGKAAGSYGECKILTFENKYVFAAAGYIARRGGTGVDGRFWNVGNITQRLYQEGNILSTDDFARKWATRMNSVLDEDSKISPPPSHNNFTLFGLFIGASDGVMFAEGVNFQSDQHGHVRPILIPMHPDKDPSDVGEGDILIEFRANTTQRAKLWHTRIDKLGPDDQIMALAKLVTEFDTTGHVGGPIDSVRMTPYAVEWLSAKPKCRTHSAAESGMKRCE